LFQVRGDKCAELFFVTCAVTSEEWKQQDERTAGNLWQELHWRCPFDRIDEGGELRQRRQLNIQKLAEYSASEQSSNFTDWSMNPEITSQQAVE